ncbi:MAG: hypothetical protein MK212_08525 [Saprospiraceae bacterium]|nr:hypothetical protein [Saprospiraceae bacterium]
MFKKAWKRQCLCMEEIELKESVEALHKAANAKQEALADLIKNRKTKKTQLEQFEKYKELDLAYTTSHVQKLKEEQGNLRSCVEGGLSATVSKKDAKSSIYLLDKYTAFLSKAKEEKDECGKLFHVLINPDIAKTTSEEEEILQEYQVVLDLSKNELINQLPEEGKGLISDALTKQCLCGHNNGLQVAVNELKEITGQITNELIVLRTQTYNGDRKKAKATRAKIDQMKEVLLDKQAVFGKKYTETLSCYKEHIANFNAQEAAAFTKAENVMAELIQNAVNEKEITEEKLEVSLDISAGFCSILEGVGRTMVQIVENDNTEDEIMKKYNALLSQE